MSSQLSISDWADYWYHKIGVNVIPIISRNKGQPEKGFGKVKYTQYVSNNRKYNFLNEEIPEEIYNEWKSDNLYNEGIAIIGGKVWRGKHKGRYLIMIDLDNRKAIDEMFPRGLEDAKNLTLIEQHLDEPNKAHVYYYSTESATKKSSTQADANFEHAVNNNEVPLIEVKGEGSHGIHVVTPSVHANGHQYEIVSNVSEPVLFVGKIEVEIDRICRRYNIPYLMEDSMKNSQIPMERLLDPNFKIPKGGGRRPALLRVLEHFYRLHQDRLDDPKLKEEGLQHGANWNNLHTEEPLDSERVYYQNDCAWNYIRRLREDNKLYTISDKESSDTIDIDKTALEIMSKFRFKTMRDNEETFIYEDGIYVKSFAESIIKEESEKAIEKCSTHIRNEIINKIKVSTYVNREEFNKDSKILVLKNGVLNISHLTFEPHSPNMLYTVKIPIIYVPTQFTHNYEEELEIDKIKTEIGETKFFKFLESCFTEDGKVVESKVYTCLEVFASVLLQTPPTHKALMLIGRGSNGKSVFLQYMSDFFGINNISSVQITDLQDDTFAVADLYGKLLNIVADIESGELSHTGKLKRLITQEEIRAQRKYEAPFIFRNRAKFIYSANRFPKVFDQSDGFFRRFMIIEFNRQFNDNERDPMLLKKMTIDTEEKSKIFNVLLAMARRLLYRGYFKHEEPTSEIRKKWNELANPILMFIDERLILTNNELDIVDNRIMFKEYQDFASQNGLSEMNVITFGRTLTQYFYADINRASGNTQRVWLGVKLKPKTQSTLSEFDKTA